MKIAEDIYDYTAKLAKAAESKARYARASLGARMLMAFLEWRRRNPNIANSQEALRYGQCLQGWMRLKDYAYVLQFETDDGNVEFLKVGALAELKRESSPSRTEVLRSYAEQYKATAGMPEEAIAPIRFEGGAAAMRDGLRRYHHRIFTGNDLPAAWPFCQKHKAYLRWLKLHDNQRTREHISWMAHVWTIQTMS